MSKSNKEFSVAKQVDHSHLLFGMCLFVTGIGLWIGNVPGEAIGIVAFICSGVNLFLVITAKKQASDEMSDEHLMRAEAKTLEWSSLILAVILAVFILLKSIGITLRIDGISGLANIYFIVKGIEHIAIGLLFRKYEKEGY